MKSVSRLLSPITTNRFGTYEVIDKPSILKKPGNILAKVAANEAALLWQHSYADYALKVPKEIRKPPYLAGNGIKFQHPQIKSPEEIQKMRKSCSFAKQTLDYAISLVKPGVTTEEINEKVFELVINSKVYPSPLGYEGYPKVICTSVNNVLVHGIPDDRPLLGSDIINIDVSVYVDGYHGDCSKTVAVSAKEVDKAGNALIQHTLECLNLGIDVCQPGRSFNEIGNVIEKYAKKKGYTVNSEFCGHGIGQEFHEPPFIEHTKNKLTLKMLPGMIFTIEPICHQGTNKSHIWDDNWTAVSVDDGRSAQFEHTVLVTNDGVEILTK
jgi:methionyl aminopeptidase